LECASQNDGGPQLGDSDQPGGDTLQDDLQAGITYCAKIKPLLDGYCVGCHSSALSGAARNGAPVGVDLDTYSGAVANATRSNIRIQANTMPPGGGMTTGQQTLFQGWVDGGLLECGGSTPGDSDQGGDSRPGGDSGGDSALGGDGPTTVTYCHQIKPVLDNYCTSCHSSALSGAARNGAPVGVDLDTYAGAVANANRSNIRIQANTMPPGGGVPANQRALFSTWVDTGLIECDGGSPGDSDITTGDDATPSCSSGVMWSAVGEYDELMMPGANCLACHSGGFDPSFSIAGTVMGAKYDMNNCYGVGGVVVRITDANTQVHTFTTNAAGNFFLSTGSGSVAAPYSVKLTYQGRTRTMSTTPSTFSCNSCHLDSGTPGRVLAP
jgi:hypothetical protein